MDIFLIILAMITTTALGGLFAIRFKDQLHLILGFSAGTVLGVALFDLLPESFSMASKTYSDSLITAMIALGFALYMIIDRSFSLHAHSDDHCENPSHTDSHRGLGAAALIFHSFLDGLGIGLAFKISPVVGWVVAVGVLTHKFSDGISTVGIILNNKKNRKQALYWLTAAAIAPAIGIISTYFMTITEPTLGLILAVFVGLFLYLSASDLIPESHHHHPTIWTTISTIAGMLMIYLAVHIAF